MQSLYGLNFILYHFSQALQSNLFPYLHVSLSYYSVSFPFILIMCRCPDYSSKSSSWRMLAGTTHLYYLSEA